MSSNISRRTFLHCATSAAIVGPLVGLSPRRPLPTRRDPASPLLRLPSNVRLRGANIVASTAADTGEPTVWAAMWHVWDWNGWIKPQIDDAATVGNAVRLLGSTQVWLAGYISESTYFSQWEQLLDYCASKGLYMIPTGSDILTNPQGNNVAFSNILSGTKAASHYTAWANLLAQYPGVVGVDLMNEAWYLPGGGYCDMNWLVMMMQTCADAMHSRNLPVTISFATNPAWDWWLWDGFPFGTWWPTAQQFWGICDYLDLHIYSDVTEDQIANAYNFSWAAGKPMVFGEFASASEDSATRTAFYENVSSLVTARSDNAGAIAWSCWDANNTDNQYGLFSSPGVLRSDIATPFAGFPTTR
jgi:hypothetical protein